MNLHLSIFMPHILPQTKTAFQRKRDFTARGFTANFVPQGHFTTFAPYCRDGLSHGRSSTGSHTRQADSPALVWIGQTDGIMLQQVAKCYYIQRISLLVVFFLSCLAEFILIEYDSIINLPVPGGRGLRAEPHQNSCPTRRIRRHGGRSQRRASGCSLPSGRRCRGFRRRRRARGPCATPS